MNPEVDTLGTLGLMASEGFSFEMLEMARCETAIENITIKTIKYMKFIFHDGLHKGRVYVIVIDG